MAPKFEDSKPILSISTASNNGGSNDSAWLTRKLSWHSRRCNSLQCMMSLMSVLSLVVLLHFLTPPGNKPVCRAIVDHRGTFSHSELLESIVADFPLELPEYCNNELTVDIYFNVWIPCKMCSRISEFMKYAKEQLSQTTYIGYKGQNRRLGKVERRLWFSKNGAIATIHSSGYCRWPFTTGIRDARMYTIFHETCDSVWHHPRAYWVSPMYPRYLFPNRLPQFPNAAISKLEPPYHFCIVGGTRRRSHHLMEYYYQTRDAVDEKVRLYLLGRGATPPELARSTNETVQLRINSFVGYQEFIATSCHVILALVDKSKHGEYFNLTDSKRKLTGSIPQASAYKLRMVLHEDLYSLYEPYLEADRMETHTEDPESFAQAMDRMVERLDHSAALGEQI